MYDHAKSMPMDTYITDISLLVLWYHYLYCCLLWAISIQLGQDN